MKLKPEIQKAMDDKSTDYIDWDELRYGDRDKSGIKESNAFREGFMYAVGYISSKGHVNGGYFDKVNTEHTASEIVRAMTNYNLTKEQKKALLYRARCVIENQMSNSSNKNEPKHYQGYFRDAAAHGVDTLEKAAVNLVSEKENELSSIRKQFVKLKNAIMQKTYYIGNPSAWEKYSEEGSEHLRDLLKEVEGESS